MAGYSTKVCAQQAHVVVSKAEEPDEEDEKRGKEKIRFLGHPRPRLPLVGHGGQRRDSAGELFLKELDSQGRESFARVFFWARPYTHSHFSTKPAYLPTYLPTYTDQVQTASKGHNSLRLVRCT
jgi:hypothetical protein